MAWPLDGAWSAIDWSQTVPGGLVLPLAHYPQLEQGPFEPRDKLALARLAACFSCELFIHFEAYLIDYLSRYPERVPTLSAKAIRRFVDEERLHSEAFRRLLGKLRPDLYPEGTSVFLMRRPSEDRALERLPAATFFLLAMLFEEITLFVPEAMRAAPQDCSELVSQVMSLHARDERGHVGIDARMLQKLCDARPRWQTRLEVWATLPMLWFVERQVARGWRRAASRARSELGLSPAQHDYLLKRQPTQSDRWGCASFIEKLHGLELPGAGLLCRVLGREIG